MSPLHPQGPAANHINDVFWPLFWVSVVVTAAVSLAILYSAFRFRRKHDDDEPEQIHGSNPLEIGWTAVPLVILIALSALTPTHRGILATPPSNAPATKVTGLPL